MSTDSLGTIRFLNVYRVSDGKPGGHTQITGWMLEKGATARKLTLSADGRKFWPAMLQARFRLLGSDSFCRGFRALTRTPKRHGSAWLDYRLSRQDGKIRSGKLRNTLAPKELLPGVSSRRRRQFKAELELFLRQGRSIPFTSSARPRLSVVVILYNQAELSLRTLTRLQAYAPANTEVILIDNASTDRTRELLGRMKGARIIRNRRNLHFIRAANQGARNARGRYLLFLNSDCEIAAGSIQAALKRIASSPEIGVVGGKLLKTAVSLQDAGFTLTPFLTVDRYGENDDPGKPQYSFSRKVAATSGAFLLTRARLFRKLGGFDRIYQPAHFEDMDYCLRVWRAGYSVVYEPRATAVHFGHASFENAFSFFKEHMESQRRFIQRWSRQLDFCEELNRSLRRWSRVS